MKIWNLHTGVENLDAKDYYVNTAAKNTKPIKEYIKNQLKQDRESDQLSNRILLKVAIKKWMDFRQVGNLFEVYQ